MIRELLFSVIMLSFCVFLLKNLGWKGAPVFAAVAAVLFITVASEELGYIFNSVKKIGKEADIGDALSSLLKVLGIGYLFGICADVCRELGENGIAKAAEVVGRVEIIAVIIPYFEEIIKVGIGLIK